MSAATYAVEIPGVGKFVFRRRKMRDQIAIEAETLRITGGETESDNLRRAASSLATLGILTVEAPKGWDLEMVDPLDTDAIAEVLKVFGGLRSAEDEFRLQLKS